MVLITYFVIILLIGTKLLDVISTLQQIRYVDQETNPIARKIMLQIGISNTVWLIFIFALIIIIFAGIGALIGGLFHQIIFVIVGIVISVIQISVACTNKYGVDNPITKIIRKLQKIK